MRRLNMILLLFISFVAFIIAPLIISYYTYSREFLYYTENEISRFADINLQNAQKMSSMMFSEINREITRIPMNESVSYIGKIKSYDTIKSNVNHILQYNKVLSLLQDATYTNTFFHSIYIYPRNADYIITTNNGIVKYDDFTDLGWLSSYEEEFSGDTSRKWIPRKIPSSVLAQYPQSGPEINVVSCVYPIKSIIAGFDGVLVANIYEKDLCDLANVSEFDSDGYCYVIDTEGNVVLHPDKSMFAQNLSDDPVISQVLASSEQSGYVSSPDSGGHTLSVYNKTDFSGWIFISSHSLRNLTAQITILRNQNLIILLVCISAGLIIISVILLNIASPMSKLLASLRGRGPSGKGVRNEFVYILKAFEEVTSQEKQLRDVVESNKDRVREMYVLDLLHGLPTRYDSDDINPINYPHESFIVLVFSVDQNAVFVERFTSEQRSYFLNFIASRCESSIMPKGVCTSAVIEGGSVAAVVNFPNEALPSINNELAQNAHMIAMEASKLVNHTFTIGVGSPHKTLNGVRPSFLQALEALGRKIVVGYGEVIFWEKNLRYSDYYYPYQRETRVLNYLSAQNFEALAQELDALSSEIHELSTDNIIQVFHVLLGVIIKYCSERDIRISSAYGSAADLYSLLADRETIAEKNDFLKDLCKKIIQYISRENNAEQSHIQMINEYINSNYKKEIDFEKMAADIGISYSYIRKIVKENTGASLLDLVNIRRINEAKLLLKETGMTLAAISGQLGYSNLQSFNRYFKKYEGITPGEYRSLSVKDDQHD